MYRIRSKFYKMQDMIFISHLDLVRLFERAFRRASIPIAYTQGFNPHPIMSFATALGIGISSEGEYIDIEVGEKIDLKEFMDKLNNVLPEGLKIVKSQYISKGEDSLMAVIQYSTYAVKIEFTEEINNEELESKINSFLDLKEIIEIKEKKKKKNYRKYSKSEVQEINIREYIKRINIMDKEENHVMLNMLLSTGSSGNLKPETVVKKLQELFELPIDIEKTRVYRIDLFKEIDPNYKTPLDVAAV